MHHAETFLRGEWNSPQDDLPIKDMYKLQLAYARVAKKLYPISFYSTIIDFLKLFMCGEEQKLSNSKAILYLLTMVAIVDRELCERFNSGRFICII